MNWTEKGTEVLSWILTSLQGAKDFVVSQAPDVIKQLLQVEQVHGTGHCNLGNKNIDLQCVAAKCNINPCPFRKEAANERNS